MSCIKAVAVAFLALGEAAHSPVFPQLVKTGLPTGEKLMGIGLMAHVPHHLVLRKVKSQVHGHGQLHDAEIRGQMAAGYTDFLNQELPDLLCQGIPLIFIQLLDIIHLIDLLQIHDFTSVLFFSRDQHANQFFQKLIPVI